MLPFLLLPILLQLAPVQWTISSPKPGSALKPGERFAVVLDAEIAEGWHLYSLRKLEGGPIPTSISVPEGQPFRLAGEIEASAPLSKFDDTFQMDVESYSYSASFQLPVDVAKDAPEASTTLTVNARFQACDDKQCLPPRTIKVQLPLNVKP